MRGGLDQSKLYEWMNKICYIHYKISFNHSIMKVHICINMYIHVNRKYKVLY